jgi:hypothetical protein
MNFIERFFHVFPDGGSGATELLYLVAALVLALGILFRRRAVMIITRIIKRVDPSNELLPPGCS